MSTNHYVTWTCDRCGHQQDEAPSHQPIQWTAIMRLDPPLFDASGVEREHLCRDCTTSLPQLAPLPRTEADDR